MKTTTSVILCSSMMLFASSRANASVLGAPILNPANNHYYYLLSPSTWTAAEAQAVTLGGHLATINNAAENAWVFSTFGGLNRPLWIGLTDQSAEGNFSWISGESFSYSNWNPGEPNSGGGFVPDEDYIYMIESNPGWPLTPSQWNDVPNDGEGVQNPVFGLVEVVPEPTVISVFGAAAFGVFALRKSLATSSCL